MSLINHIKSATLSLFLCASVFADNNPNAPTQKIDEEPLPLPAQFAPNNANAQMPMPNAMANSQELAAQKAAEEAAKQKAKKEYFASIFPPIEKATNKIEDTLWQRYWWAFTIAGGCLIGILWLILKPRKVRPKTPYERAIERLGIASNTSAQESAKVYASKVSQAVRDYIEEVHHIPAPERTTEEFLLLAVESGKFDAPQNNRISDILKLSDMAKFALHSFKDEERKEILNNAFTFIDADQQAIAESLKNAKTKNSSLEEKNISEEQR